MTGERKGNGLRGRLAIYASGKGASSGLGEHAFDRASEAHSIAVVASDLDDSTERIAEYLSSTYAVPINVMLSRCFSDRGQVSPRARCIR